MLARQSLPFQKMELVSTFAMPVRDDFDRRRDSVPSSAFRTA
jgi:hypothetical protein